MRAFDGTVGRLELIGARPNHAPLSGRSRAAGNPRIVAETGASVSLAPGERLALLGYSKGAPDIRAAPVEHAAGTACGPHDGVAIAARHPSPGAAWRAESAGPSRVPVGARAPPNASAYLPCCTRDETPSQRQTGAMTAT
jgi:hypothetical protein